jgi:hypothetical protein
MSLFLCRVRSCRPVELPSGRAARRALSRCGAQRLLGSEAARFTLRRQPTNGWRGGASPKGTVLPGVRDGSAQSPARPRWLRHAPPVSGSLCLHASASRSGLEGLRARSQRSRGAATASRARDDRRPPRICFFETLTRAAPAEGPQGP